MLGLHLRNPNRSGAPVLSKGTTICEGMTAFCPRSLIPRQAGLTGVVFLGTGSLVTSGSHDGLVKLWDLRGAFHVPPVPSPVPVAIFGTPSAIPDHGVAAISLSNSEGFLAVASLDQR